MKVKSITLKQTKEALLESMKRNHEALKGSKHKTYWHDKQIPAVESADLDALDGNWEYTTRLALSQDKKKDKIEIIAHQVVWDEEKEVYDFLNEKVVAVCNL